MGGKNTICTKKKKVWRLCALKLRKRKKCNRILQFKKSTVLRTIRSKIRLICNQYSILE